MALPVINRPALKEAELTHNYTPEQVTARTKVAASIAQTIEANAEAIGAFVTPTKDFTKQLFALTLPCPAIQYDGPDGVRHNTRPFVLNINATVDEGKVADGTVPVTKIALTYDDLLAQMAQARAAKKAAAK